MKTQTHFQPTRHQKHVASTCNAAQPSQPFASLFAWLRVGQRAAHSRHHRFVEGVLGTTLELQIVAVSPQLGPQIEAEMRDEIDRLAAIFSLYQSDSEFNRWQETFDQDVAVSPELMEVLARSEMWRARSDNAFNPAVEVMSQLWKSAAPSGNAPTVQEMQRLSRAISAPLWSVDVATCCARRLTSYCASLNSIAKGFIVDRACLLAQREGVEDVLLNIGGDLRHTGRNGITVGIADPFTLADNAPPVAKVRLHNSSVATSGRARRGFQIGERWFSHVLDPRTGWPVERTISASVLAADALTADVLATVCSVMAPDEALQIADALPAVGIYLLDESGHSVSNAFWRAHAV